MTTGSATSTTATAARRVEDSEPDTSSRAWLVVAAAMFVIGWGGNEFTPLLVVYRQAGYSAVSVDVFLGAYVLGLIPGLLLAPAVSDRRGRRPVVLVGVLASMLGSAVLAVGDSVGAAALIGGRLLSGLAIGIAMAVGTAWVNELSTSPGASRNAAGARRSSVALTFGLGAGPGVAGLLAQWGPLPLVLPYLIQIAVAVPVLTLVWRRSVETVLPGRGRPLRHALQVNSFLHKRFLLVVLPMAPWIFGSAGIAYAIVPALVEAKVGHWALLFTTALTVATLATGLAVQPIAKRLDDDSTARAVLISMVLMSAGVIGAALTAATTSPWLAGPVALMLGAAYGIALVSGLLEVQRLAPPGDLAGLTGIYYALAYVGFLLPAALAALTRVAGYPLMLSVVAVVAIGCTSIIGSASRKHLPVG